MNHTIQTYILDLTKEFIQLFPELAGQLPRVVLRTTKNENLVFDPTAYYDQVTKTIVLYVRNRHVKDILRSFAHEMIHHIQNIQNRLPSPENLVPGYILTSKEYQFIEAEAYLKGNMIFRTWEDKYKTKNNVF